MNLILPAAEFYAAQVAAEASFQSGGYASDVHDIYIHGYMEALIIERRKIAEERAAKEATP